MPRALLLDMGNVIVFFDHHRACRQLAALGQPGTAEDAVFDLLFHQPLERHYDCGEISTTTFLATLREAFGITASDESIARAWSDIFEPNRVLAAEMPELRRRFDRLVLASNTNELHISKVRALMPETLALFDEQVLSFEVGYRKPADEFFRRAIDAGGGDPARCVYVDDRQDFVAAAELLGMDAILYGQGTIL
jgi:HAD superfamily hydrolase (TIGR01509 family)